MKFQQVIQNDKGIAVLLGLFVLFVVTIAGISLLLISQRDKIAAADASAIRNVAFAADASLKACEGQLAKQPDTVVAILNKYVKDINYKWLLNPNSNSALTENKISLGSGGLKYSACITAYDKENMILQIKGIGYGRSNEQKNVMGLFKLNGIEVVSAGTPMHYALYSVNSMIMDKIMDIRGDVYIGNGFTFNGGAQNSVIHGFMKTAVNTNQESYITGNLTIDSSFFVGTNLRNGAQLTCKSKAAFQGRVVIDNTTKIQNEAWFNDTNAGNQNIDMSGKTIHHSGHITMARISNGIEDNKKAPIADIAGQIGFSSAADTPWSVNISGLLSIATTVENLSITDLQKIYDTTSNSRKINGYIVLKDQWGSIGINGGGSGFKGKVIWLLSKGINVNGNWFKADTSSRMLIYAYDWASLNGFGSSDGMVFKGFICLNDSASFTSGGSGNNYYYGAIHAIHSKAKLQVNSGAQMFLYYNDPVLSEFVSMGILKRSSSAGSTGAAGTIALKDCKIRPKKVGVVY